MWVLGIDTSGLQLHVALCSKDQTFLRKSAERRTQGELVQGFINELLAEAGITQNNLAAIVVVSGPGSFTGLRLALALGQGMARGLNIPVTGLDRITLLRGVVGQGPVIMLESLRAELYVDFGTGVEMLTPVEIKVRLAGRALVGDGAPHLGQEALDVEPEAVLAARVVLSMDLTALPPAAPFYVRPPDVTVAKA